MILLVDNFDSFTYNLVDYFEQLGEKCFVVRNDVSPEDLPAFDFTKIVLSPGPGKPEDAGYLLRYIEYFQNRLPILGICLGHQAIAQYFGAEVVKAIKPMHGKVSVIEKCEDDELFFSIPERWEVVRYHSLVAKGLEKLPLKPLAYSAEGELMVLKHKVLDIYGIQYHPEAVLTQFGLKVLSNWLKNIKSQEKAEASLL